jgi:uncharacterized protein YjhX (UPF0386 family)
MSLKKQEFYEGAALHVLARTGQIAAMRYDNPFFVVNHRVWLLIKYSTRGRSPWGFTFTIDEQRRINVVAQTQNVCLGLICGHDGIATLSHSDYALIADQQGKPFRIACFRDHGQHYEISGPTGRTPKKIAPSAWSHILHNGTKQ